MNSLVTVALFTFWAIAFLILSTHVYFSDSEIWSINLGLHFFEDLKHSWVFTRPVFHLALWLINLPFSENYEIFVVSRLLFGLVGVTLVYMTIKLAQREFKSDRVALMAGFILAVHPTFLHQGFRVRSDLLASALFLASWLWLPKSFIAQIIAPLLATPKGILFSAYGFFSQIRQPEIIKHLFIFIGLTLIAAMCQWSYVVENLRDMTPTSPFDWLQKSSNVYAMFRLAPWFAVLVVTRLFLRAQTETEKRWQIGLGLICVVWLVFPSRTPFLLAALLPLASISLASCVDSLFTLITEPRLKRFLNYAVPFYLVAQAGFFVFHNLKNNSNDTQLRTLGALDNYFKRYQYPLTYDVIGLDPRRNSIRYFLGPHQESVNLNLLERFEQTPPEFVLRVSKLAYGGNPLIQYLADHFVYLGYGVFGRAVQLPWLRPPKHLARRIEYEAKLRPWISPYSRIAVQVFKIPNRKTGFTGNLEIITPTLTELLEELRTKSTVQRGWEFVMLTLYAPISLPGDLHQTFKLDLQPIQLFDPPNSQMN